MAEPRHNLDAFIAFRMLSFPIPPLPLLANRGDEGADAIASSHDLIARAMQLQYFESKIESKIESKSGHDTAKIQQVMKEKEDICLNMIRDVAALWTQKEAQQLTDEDMLERCYLVFQHSFRQYMAHYPGSADLRFAPLADVHRGTNVHSEAVHFLRRLALSVEDSGLVTDLECQQYDKQTYAQVLKRYVLELYETYEDRGD